MAILQQKPTHKKAYERLVNTQLQDATNDWVKALRKRANIQYFNK